MFNNIRLCRYSLILAILLVITSCQVSNPGLSSQKPTLDIGEEPPTILGDSTTSPIPIPTIQKKPADSNSPAAGICATQTEDVVLITIAPGPMPDPRCVKVTASQRLQIKNGTEESVRIQLGLLDMTLKAGEVHTFNTPCGDFLEPGVHWATLSNGSVPEIWLATSP